LAIAATRARATARPGRAGRTALHRRRARRAATIRESLVHRTREGPRVDGSWFQVLVLPETSADTTSPERLRLSGKAPRPRRLTTGYDTRMALRIAITTMGGMGDVQPYLALTRALLARGHDAFMVCGGMWAPRVRDV